MTKLGFTNRGNSRRSKCSRFGLREWLVCLIFIHFGRITICEQANMSIWCEVFVVRTSVSCARVADFVAIYVVEDRFSRGFFARTPACDTPRSRAVSKPTCRRVATVARDGLSCRGRSAASLEADRGKFLGRALSMLRRWGIHQRVAVNLAFRPRWFHPGLGHEIKSGYQSRSRS